MVSIWSVLLQLIDDICDLVALQILIPQMFVSYWKLKSLSCVWLPTRLDEVCAAWHVFCLLWSKIDLMLIVCRSEPSFQNGTRCARWNQEHRLEAAISCFWSCWNMKHTSLFTGNTVNSVATTHMLLYLYITASHFFRSKVQCHALTVQPLRSG